MENAIKLVSSPELTNIQCIILNYNLPCFNIFPGVHSGIKSKLNERKNVRISTIINEN